MPLNTKKEYNYLSIQQILSETITFCTENLSSIFNSLKYPGLGILLLSLITREEFNFIDLPLIILEMYFYFVFVVRCHRLFLLNESPDSIKEALLWDKRNTTFMFTSIALAFGLGVIFIPIIIFTTSMGNFLVLHDNSSILFVYITAIPFGYLFSRLSLVFPAIAIDKQNDFQRAWVISKGNGWKLFFLISVIPLTTSFIIGTIISGQLFFKLIAALLGVLVLMLEVVILSNSYKILNNNYKEPNQTLNADSGNSPAAG